MGIGCLPCGIGNPRESLIRNRSSRHSRAKNKLWTLLKRKSKGVKGDILMLISTKKRVKNMLVIHLNSSDQSTNGSLIENSKLKNQVDFLLTHSLLGSI